MSAKHTPGPWTINSDGVLVINGNPTETYAADFSDGTIDYHEAFANLTLAAAAPELLEELNAQVDLAERVYNALRDIAPADMVENIIDMLAPHTRTAARAAIAKAKGR